MMTAKMQNTTEIPTDANLERNIKLAVYLVTIALGLVGNVLVIMVVVAKKVRRSANDIFIMNLAVADLTLIFILPIDIYIMFNSFPESAFFCNFLLPFNNVPFVVSIFTLTSMAIHRCHVILNPFRREMRQRIAILWVAVIWIVSFAILLPLMIVSEPTPSIVMCQEKWKTVEHRKAYTATLFVLQYLLPLLIIAVAYIRIGLDLYQARLPCVSPPRRREYRNSAEDKARNRENAQVIKMLAIIVILFALCMFPIQVAWMLLEFGGPKEQKASAFFLKFSLVLAVFHSCLNPLVYGTLTRQFRRGYMKYISCCCACCKNRLPESIRSLRTNETEITTASVRRSMDKEQHQMNSLSNGFHNIGEADSGSMSLA